MDIRIIEDDFERVPGLYGAWDLGMLLEEGRCYLIEDGGRTDDGQPLYMVFYRQVPSGNVGGTDD
ncbi:hypothetical protein [Meridianimarinicoccus sp. MJW13]|uniref:hypothetical protein n=1 Tax=Meridianimarinicoccus sp. MJW13 TaxID=2720031 RepID=UPI001867E4DA|nr:hypothetical protein [Fluviibacterium sp. MJW13]